MNGPWLTIVTVVKDDAAGFGRTLTSLQGEELDGVEYLVIDSSADATTIPSLLHAAGLTARVEWTEATGIYAAMNRGLALAAGRYIHFLNAGDELIGSTLEAVRARLDQDPVWAFGPVEIVQQDGSIITTPPWDYPGERATLFSNGRFPPHQGTFAQTSELKAAGGFDTGFAIAADYAAFLHLSKAGEPAVIDHAVARFYEGGVSTDRWSRSVLEFHRARRRILRPTGLAAVVERLRTLRHWTALAAYRSPWPLASALTVMTFALMALTGVAPTSAATLTLAVVLQGIGGAVTWRLLQPTRAISIIEVIGMGLALGTAGSMAVGLVIAWWVAPLAALILWFIIPGRRHRTRLGPLPRAGFIGLMVGLVPGIGAFMFALRNYPLTWSGFWSAYHGDMPFFEALSIGVAKLGPGASIFMEGADLRYHSLVYGWAGQLTVSLHAEPFVVLTRLLPLITLIAAVLLVTAWARNLSVLAWVPGLAALLLVTGGFVGANFGSILNFDSPSQSMGVIWMLALSILLMRVLHEVWRARIVPLVPAIILLVFSITGGKISIAAIAVGAFLVVTAFAFVRRESWRWAALATAIASVVTMVVTYLWLLAGSTEAGGLALFSLLDRASSVQGLNPVITPRGIIAGIALMVIAVVPRWAGLLWSIGDRTTRWKPETVYGLGLALGGVATILVLSGGFNDLWFTLAASAPLAVLSAVGVGQACSWLGSRQRWLLAASWGLIISAVAAALWVTGSTGIIGNGWRWVAPVAAVLLATSGALVLARRTPARRGLTFVALMIVTAAAAAVPARIVYAVAEPLARPHEGSLSPVLFAYNEDLIRSRDDAPYGWSDTQAAAGRWLATTAGPLDLIATNRTNSPLVSALTHLPTFISDIHRQAPYGRPDDLAMIEEREAASWAFITDPNRETVAPLCEAGVTWVWVDLVLTQPQQWELFADVVRRENDVVILRLKPSACG